MKVTRLRIETPTKLQCPSLHVTEAASPALTEYHARPGEPSLIVQGKKITDPEALAALDLPDDETAVEVPIRLLLNLTLREVTGGAARMLRSLAPSRTEVGASR